MPKQNQCRGVRIRDRVRCAKYEQGEDTVDQTEDTCHMMDFVIEGDVVDDELAEAEIFCRGNDAMGKNRTSSSGEVVPGSFPEIPTGCLTDKMIQIGVRAPATEMV